MRVRTAVAVGLVLVVSGSVPAGSQAGPAPQFAVVERGAGAVSVFTGMEVIRVAEGLPDPRAISVEPGGPRLLVVDGGDPDPPAGATTAPAATPTTDASTPSPTPPSASPAPTGVLWEIRPGAPPRHLVTGLADPTGVTVAGTGEIVVTDGAQLLVLRNGTLELAAVLGGRSVGVAPGRELDHVLVSTAGGPVVDVSLENGVALPVTAPVAGAGQAAYVASLPALCIPDAVAVVVRCLPIGGGAVLELPVLGDVPIAVATDPVDPDRLLVAHRAGVSVLRLPSGAVERVLTVDDSAGLVGLVDASPWRGSPDVTPPGSREQEPLPRWLLVVAALAGAGAIGALVVARRASAGGSHHDH